MTPIVPRIAVFSKQQINTSIKTSDPYHWIANGFEVHVFNNPIPQTILERSGFSLIITIGNKHYWKQVISNTIPIVNYTDMPEGDTVYKEYINSIYDPIQPTVSVFTPAYNTFEKFDRCYEGMKSQTYTNWEWVILDDSPDKKNYDYIENLVKNDSRIKLYKSNVQDGFVGSTKRQAASLCNGKYLLELDHDDELTHMALEYIVAAFKKFPDAGFCYSNSAETFETGGYVNYGPNFGMHQGLHFPYYYKGKFYNGSDTPINASTMRHIVGVPNHIRCWERDTYFRIQRHNNKLPIVDDYELLIRTFINTRMIHVPEMLYIQYMNAGGNNTQEPRRAEIQRLVDRIQIKYDLQIHNRILELGGEDWVWNEQTQQAELWKLPPIKNRRSTLAYVYKI